MDGGAWWATVHGVIRSWTRLSDFTFTFHCPVPLPVGYSSVSSSWLYCCVWGGLSVFGEFVKFSLLWSFLSLGGVVSVACQGFLVREACVGVLVGGAGFLLSGVQ